jgi:glycosyltransferase involved in cell wall biosynthesis
VLSQAFAQVAYKHRDARLLLVGDWDCDYSDSLHKYIDDMKLGDRITTVPVVPDPFPWYALSDIFALISDIESMPRSLMETMYFGVPALATGVFGVPEIIEDGENGYLVTVNRACELAEKLDMLLSAPKADLERTVSKARQTIIDGYRSTHYAKAYRHLIRELAGAGEE